MTLRAILPVCLAVGALALMPGTQAHVFDTCPFNSGSAWECYYVDDGSSCTGVGHFYLDSNGDPQGNWCYVGVRTAGAWLAAVCVEGLNPLDGDLGYCLGMYYDPAAPTSVAGYCIAIQSHDIYGNPTGGRSCL